MLQTNGRYTHHHKYVTAEATSAGFVVLQCKSAPIRRDGPHEVLGLLVISRVKAKVSLFSPERNSGSPNDLLLV